jgi:hypothetical protein
MSVYKLIVPDQKWDKRVIRIANNYNRIIKKSQIKPDKNLSEKVHRLLAKIEKEVKKKPSKSEDYNKLSRMISATERPYYI